MLEKADYNLLKSHREEKVEYTAKVLIEKEKVPYKEGEENYWQHQGASIPAGEVGRDLCELDHKICGTSANSETNRMDENENIAHERRTNSACCAPDEDKEVEDAANKCQTCDPEMVKDAEHSNDQSSKLQNSGNGCIDFKQESKDSVDGQIKHGKGTETDTLANRNFVFGYFTGMLSEACKDAGRKLQGTRDIIQNVRVGDMKVVLSQYVTMMSQELPLIHRMQLKPEPVPFNLAETKVTLGDPSKDGTLSLPQTCGTLGDPSKDGTLSLPQTCATLGDPSKDGTLSLPQTCGTLVMPGVTGCPEGSVLSLKSTCPAVFRQTLVQLPPALARLQSLSSQEILEKLESLSPRAKVNKLASIFWLQTANIKQPIPNTGCLLLSDEDMIVLSSGTNLDDTVAVRHHLNLQDIKKVQISLAGQHVRLIGSSEDPVLVVFTHSKELTQEFCKALLKLLSPERFPEGTEDHPLLSGDLTALSLDWTSSVPDIVLDNGLLVTSRFKRVLADLLYIVHGNMEGPGKPSLANVCPLLYTSVKVENAARGHQDAIFQFLLTDTHMALLLEDGVFHPVPRGSSLAPVQPPFRGLELRKRSDIGCLVVRRNDNCLVVDVTFTTRKPQTGAKRAESRRCSAEVLSVSDRGRRSDSWKLTFGCYSEAVILINHLST